MKAVGLFSGGLDSTLAAKLISDQGVAVDALHIYTIYGRSVSAFTSPPRKSELGRDDEAGRAGGARRMAAQLGIELTLVDGSEDFLEMIRRPRFGYGSGANPCLDCRIMTLRKAKARMEAIGAQLVFTGEVLGQRPMSQRRDTLRIVERESGLDGLLLRPLSAKLLPPTVPEQEGWVDRVRLLDLSGRSRKPQIELARRWGIIDYPQPAGGCFLTDKTLARRIFDLRSHGKEENLSKEDLILSKVGRHFRLSDSVKVIVGRREGENDFLQRYAEGRWTLEAADVPGPLALVEGELSPEAARQAAALVARYSDGKTAERVEVHISRGEEAHIVVVSPADDARIEAWRI